jgi:hypothetical protein
MPQILRPGQREKERWGAGPHVASVRVYNGASELISEDDVRLNFPAPVEIVHPSAGEQPRAPDLRHAWFADTLGHMRVAVR